MNLSVAILLSLLLAMTNEGISSQDKTDNNSKTKMRRSISSGNTTPPSVSISPYLIQNRRLFSPAVNQEISSLAVMDESVGYRGKRMTGNLKRLKFKRLFQKQNIMRNSSYSTFRRNLEEEGYNSRIGRHLLGEKRHKDKIVLKEISFK